MIESYPEYMHFLEDKLVDSWYLYKLEHSLCLLQHILRIMKGRGVTKEQETKILLLIMAIESESCNVNLKKISESIVIKEILKDHQDNLKIYLYYAYLLIIRKGIPQALKVIGGIIVFHKTSQVEIFEILHFMFRFH